MIIYLITASKQNNLTKLEIPVKHWTDDQKYFSRPRTRNNIHINKSFKGLVIRLDRVYKYSEFVPVLGEYTLVKSSFSGFTSLEWETLRRVYTNLVITRQPAYDLRRSIATQTYTTLLICVHYQSMIIICQSLSWEGIEHAAWYTRVVHCRTTCDREN